MATHPKKHIQATHGSNLWNERLLAHRSKLLAAQDRIYQREAREYRRQFKNLLSRADLRTASDIVDRARNDWHSANLNAGSDSEARDARKIQARRTLNRLLAAALPCFRQWQTLRNAHLRQHRKLAKLRLGRSSSERVHVAWGDILHTADPDAQDFVAPFSVYALNTIDDVQLISRDQSFVAYDAGNMMNAFEFNYRDDPAVIVGLFGLIRPESASHLVSCGINFTTPRAGRLRISAVLQNFYSEVLYSLRDNFGFSYGMLDIRLQLFIATARGGSVTYLPTTVLSTRRTSDGDDVNGSMSGLDGSAPYTVYGTTDEWLPKSSSVQILAGSEVHIESELDDMASHVNAVVRWQLKKITVGMI